MTLGRFTHAGLLSLLLAGAATAECLPPQLPDFMSGGIPASPSAAEHQAAQQQHTRFVRDKQGFQACLGQEVQAAMQRRERPDMAALRERMDAVNKQEQAEQRQYAEYTQKANVAANARDRDVPRELLYQDAKLSIYDDTKYSSQIHKRTVARLDLTVIHKAGIDEPLFEVKPSKRDGLGYFEYGPGVMDDFRKQLPKVFESKRYSTVNVQHFVEGQVLPPNPFFPEKLPLGSPVAEITFMNKRNSETFLKNPDLVALDIQLGKKYSPEGWSYYGDTAGSSDRGFIARRLLNTLARAQLGRYADEAVAAPIDKAKVLAAQARPQDPPPVQAAVADDSPEPFGYLKYQPLVTLGKTAYFVVEQGASYDLKLVAVHAVGEQEPVVDLDVFPMMWGIERVLGYFIADEAVAAFNRDLGPRLDKLRSDETRVWIHHYVKGRPLPGPAFSAADRPVFISVYSKTPAGWRPVYRSLQGLRPVGLFGEEQRYSHASTLQAMQASDKYKRSGFREKQDWTAEADAYYRQAPKEAVNRRSRFALWTEGYWLFNRSEIGRDLIDGKFERIPRDEQFTFFYSFFLLHYSHHCRDQMKNPTSFKHTETTRHRSRYGGYWDEISATSTIHMEERFAAKYDEYYRKGAPEPGQRAVTIPDSVDPIRAFTAIESCQAPVTQRLLENLYRRSQGLPAVASETALP